MRENPIDKSPFYERGDLQSLRIIPFQFVVFSGAPGFSGSSFKLETNQELWLESCNIHVFSQTAIGSLALLRNDLQEMEFQIMAQDGTEVINSFPTFTIPPIQNARLISLFNHSSNIAVTGGGAFFFQGTGEFPVYRTVPPGKFKIGIQSDNGTLQEYAVGGFCTGYVINH